MSVIANKQTLDVYMCVCVWVFVSSRPESKSESKLESEFESERGRGSYWDSSTMDVVNGNGPGFFITRTEMSVA